VVGALASKSWGQAFEVSQAVGALQGVEKQQQKEMALEAELMVARPA